MQFAPLFAPSPTLSLILTGQARKDKAEKRLRYYADEQSSETLSLIAKRWQRPEDFRVFSLNIVRAITNKLASIYRHPPRRVFDGVDQDTGEQLYRIANADVVLKRASRLTKLLKTTMLQVSWRNDGPALAIVTPNILDVEYSDPERPSRVLITHPASKPMNVEYSDWTATTYRRLDYKGRPLTIADNPSGINPYGVLPFVACFDRYPDDKFFLPGGDDLIEAQEALNVGLANLWRAIEYQAHGQMWVTGVKAGEAIQTGPDRAVTLPEGGQLGFAAPNGPIEEILGALEFVMRQTAATNNVSADVFDLSKSAQSGSAKMVELRDLHEARQDDMALWRTYEGRLFEVVKRVTNTHKPATVSEDASIAIDFAELKETLSETARLENYQRRLELGIGSPVDFFLSENPDFGTREQAFEELSRRKDEAEKLQLVL